MTFKAALNSSNISLQPNADAKYITFNFFQCLSPFTSTCILEYDLYIVFYILINKILYTFS